ncbi:MAG: hypothetical protein FOGNACKC_00254 [Anaerolineae bacterium]|nr:hypothetical protein [Anaerolineae bacterium]
MIPFICVTSLIFGALGLYLLARAGAGIAANSPDLPGALRQDIKKLLPGLFFWMPLGATFGGLGAIGLMWLVGIPLRQATGWVLFGVGIGAVWGVLWSIIYGLTERQS